MFKIVHNKIYLTRGDTARFDITIGNNYTLKSNDHIYFIVTEYPDIVDIDDLGRDEFKYLFYKEGLDIVINPSDTKYLERDTYYYQVRLVIGSTGDRTTIIEPEEFRVTPIIR